MKKLTLILGVVALMASTTSCKKEYTCECTFAGGSSSVTFEETKKDAESACDDTEAGLIAVGSADASCTLK